MKINELNLNPKIEDALKEMGYENFTEVQVEAIPKVMEGRDIIAQSNTGTGKTAAFGIPLLQKIDTDNRMPQAIVITPTRELAVQISKEFDKMSQYMSQVSIVTVFGGSDIGTQIRKIKKGVQIIVGTPGRLIDLIRRKVIKLEDVQMTVLDEADEMLKMGFKEDIELVLENIGHKTQILLFSATMPKPIQNIAKTFLDNPAMVKTLREGITAKEVKQNYFIIRHKDKIEALGRVLDTYCNKLTVIFCNTKRSVDEVFDVLVDKGYNCDKIHGDINQAQRLDTLNKFNNGLVDVLVATDVAARGLDIKEVEAVINYEVPQKEEYYVHRIGRTGRAGREGVSFTLATNKELRKIQDIERYTKKSIRKRSIPSLEKVNKIKVDKFVRNLETEITANEDNSYEEIIERLLTDGYEPKKIISTLIKSRLNFVDEKNDRDINDTNEPRSGRVKSERNDRAVDRSGVKFFLNLGARDGIRKSDILGAVASESNIPGKEIGTIEILRNFSFFTVNDKFSSKVLDKMNKASIKGKPCSVEVTTSNKNRSSNSGSRSSNGGSYGRSSDGGRNNKGNSNKYKNKRR